MLIELSGVHAARALDQVVGFVHQQGDAPLIEQGEAIQQTAHVEVIVVIADHHIRPAAQLLAQVVRADLMRQGGGTHAFMAQPLAFECGLAGSRQAVVKAFGQRAGVAMAGFVGVFAGLVARHMLQYPQRHRLFLAA